MNPTLKTYVLDLLMVEQYILLIKTFMIVLFFSEYDRLSIKVKIPSTLTKISYK
jgi:hypothetical protein